MAKSQGSTGVAGSLYGEVGSHEASLANEDGSMGLVYSFSIKAALDEFQSVGEGLDARVEFSVVHKDPSFHADSHVANNMYVDDE
ncbi:hypothetical protein V6N13_047066 [Hibiscus sabdariffa]